MSRIAVIGMVGNSAFLPVEHFHVGGETVKALSAHFEPGGKGFNQAVAAARFGAEVSFLGAVGADYGDQVRRYAAEDGMHTVLVEKQGPGAFAAILTDAEGTTHVTVYQGEPLDVSDVELFGEEIARADILLLNNEVPEAVNRRAVEIAVQNGVQVILNPAPARPLDPYLAEHVALFTPNEHETLGIEQHKNVIVTLGSKGCLIKQTNERVPAVSAGKVVDTTGAGDTFNGVLAAMLGDGATLLRAVEVATVASGICVTRPYAAGSIPTKVEIDALL